MAAWAVAPAPLTTLRQIHALSNEQAHQHLPVAFPATVTYIRNYEQTLFVQDGDIGIFISIPKSTKLLPGDRILVHGETRDSFNPYVMGESVTLLGHTPLPKPLPVKFDQMISAQVDCRLVTVRGVIRAADYVPYARYTNLQLLTDGGYFDATVDGVDTKTMEGLLDDELEITGVASESFDSKMQVTGAYLHIQSVAQIKILHRVGASPWSLPATPMDRVLSVFYVNDRTQRVRVHGTITYFEPGVAVILQDGLKSIWIATQTRNPLHVGDIADAIGFPNAPDGFLSLTHGEVRDGGAYAPVAPLPVTWAKLVPHGNSAPGHHFDLVSIEGQVVSQFREASQDEYVLDIDGKLMSAVFRHLFGPPAYNKQIPLGSRVRVDGICFLEESNPFIDQVPFKILMRSPDDITVLSGPPWVSIRNLLLLAGLLLALVLTVGVRSWLFERKVRRKTTMLAAVEQRRSRILEDINGSRPLAEVLEEITGMISFIIGDAPCWCEVTNGATLGNFLRERKKLSLIHEDIPARTGPPLGRLFAALDSKSPYQPQVKDALLVGARLATLAIETRRLYTDLRRRSEFDLLTDIPNRFALEKHLGALIEKARQDAGIFGLIYVDLDKFKPVNDRYGHHIGDLYLQEVALRMKRQMRGGDILARLGGDEFAALVSEARSRAGVEEIARRLERCFDEPFLLEGILLQGAASIGLAIYPEDGATRDSILNAADAAMYAAKHAKSPAETGLVKSKRLLNSSESS